MSDNPLNDTDGVRHMMGCGHAANSMSNGKPACVICAGIHPGAHVVVERMSLAGRTAICSYGGETGVHSKRPDGGPIYGVTPDGKGGGLDGPVVSDWNLPFFRHRPEREHDEFFCGCWGWD